MPTVYRLFHRITHGSQPTRDDFTSNEAMGIRPIDGDPDRARLNDGISVFNTEQQARNKALTYPELGTFIARLEVPGGVGVRVERTLRSAGHHTIWGEPDELLSCVVSVVRV